MRARTVRLLVAWLVFGLLFLDAAAPVRQTLAAPAPHPLPSGHNVIAAVNALRQANGLPAYNIDGALMAAAQAHSEFQAQNNTITHTGAGGSSPASRARAAGYGGGALISISENIAGGGGMSAQGAVRIWQADALHLNTMLSPNYTDAGAGLASSGDSVYITLLVGAVTGQAGSHADNGSGGQSKKPAAPSGPTAVAMVPLQAATPGPDGAIIHVVDSGQALWNIAALYGISLDELRALNYLSENAYIHPGDRLLVKPPNATTAPEPSATITDTAATRLPAGPENPNLAPTSPPTYTPAALSAVEPAQPTAALALNAPAPDHSGGALQPDPAIQTTKGNLSNAFKRLLQDPVLLGIFIMFCLSLALILFGTMFNRHSDA